MKKTEKKTYRELRAELDSLMEWFEQGNVDVDEAILKHAEATALLKELEAYLSNVEQKISTVE